MRAKFVLSMGLLGFLCLMLPGSLRAGTITFSSVNTSSSPYDVNVNTTGILGEYGITLTNVTSGTVDVVCATCGGGYLVTSTPPNVLIQFGSAGGESYTLDFSTPLSSLSFAAAGDSKSGGSGTLVAAWSVTAYNASNGVVASVVSPDYPGNFGTYSPFAPQPYELSGSDITHVTVYTQCNDSCGTWLAIDDFSSPQITQIPEPSSYLLLGTGLLGLLGLAGVSKRRAPYGTS
jgi:hypothetical protein